MPILYVSKDANQCRYLQQRVADLLSKVSIIGNGSLECRVSFDHNDDVKLTPTTNSEVCLVLTSPKKDNPARIVLMTPARAHVSILSLQVSEIL